MLQVEIVKCLYNHNGIGRSHNRKEEPIDFESGHYYLCIKSAHYNIPYVYKEQQINSAREHDWFRKRLHLPVLFEHVRFLNFANKKELKKFKKKYFEDRSILLEEITV